MKLERIARVAVGAALTVATAAAASGSQVQYRTFRPTGTVPPILSEWEQVKIMETQLRWRQRHVVPEVMRRAGVDVWIIGRGEGVGYLSLIEADDEGLVPGRPDLLVFVDSGQEVSRQQLDVEDLQAALVAATPRRLAIAPSTRERLGENFQGSFEELYGDVAIDSELLVRGFLEKRSPAELVLFDSVARIAHEIIAESFSNRTIIPDLTTSDELNWWIRQRYIDLGLPTSDHPTITVQRSRLERSKYSEDDEHFRVDIPPRNGYNTVIRRGDVISNDTGINYLALGTDTQQVAYVLHLDETEPPAGLLRAMANTVRLQEFFAAEFVDGRPAYEIVGAALSNARAEGLRAEIYSHPIPYFLKRYSLNGGFFRNVRHGAGPSLDAAGRDGPSRRGRYPVFARTAYAMELDTVTSVPEWGGQDVRIVLEQTIAFDGERVIFLGGRQTELYVIR